MFNQNRKSLENLELQMVNDNLPDSKESKIREYRQPEVHHLGNLEKVQGNYSGSQTDASRNFYYN